MNRRVVGISLVLWLACAVWVITAWTLLLRADAHSPARAANPPAAGGGPPAPRIRLDDARGRRVDTADLIGRPYLVTFLGASCPRSCRLTLRSLSASLRRFGSRGRDVDVLAVSPEPGTHGRDAVRSWLRREPPPPAFHHLTGSRRQLRPLWRAYGVEDLGDVHRGHDLRGVRHTHPPPSFGVWLVDRRGRLRSQIVSSGALTPANVIHELEVLLEEPLPGAADGARTSSRR